MITTSLNRINIVTKIVKVGVNTFTFIHSNGREITANSLIWSAYKSYDDHEEPTSGRVNFYQGGAGSGTGIVGFTVSESTPMTFEVGGIPTVCSTLNQAIAWINTNLA